MTNSSEIGTRMKAQRELLGLTREELAERLDITPRFCYDLELGLKGMSIPTLCKLSNVLKVSADYLLFGESPEEQGISNSLALLKSCPAEKRDFLNQIISIYLQAVKE